MTCFQTYTCPFFQTWLLCSLVPTPVVSPSPSMKLINTHSQWLTCWSQITETTQIKQCACVPHSDIRWVAKQEMCCLSIHHSNWPATDYLLHEMGKVWVGGLSLERSGEGGMGLHMSLTHPVHPTNSTEAEIEVRMREDFSKVCFETLLQFSFSNKTSTPQEGLISRMALTVLLQRSQDVLRRYVEDERLSGRCPLPRYVTATVCPNLGGTIWPSKGSWFQCFTV